MPTLNNIVPLILIYLNNKYKILHLQQYKLMTNYAVEKVIHVFRMYIALWALLIHAYMYVCANKPISN